MDFGTKDAKEAKGFIAILMAAVLLSIIIVLKILYLLELFRVSSTGQNGMRMTLNASASPLDIILFSFWF